MKQKRCYGVLFNGATANPPIQQCSAVGISRGGLCFDCTQRANVGYWTTHLRPAFYSDGVGPPRDDAPLQAATEQTPPTSRQRPVPPKPVATARPKPTKPRGSVWMSRKEAQRIIHGGE